MAIFDAVIVVLLISPLAKGQVPASPCSNLDTSFQRTWTDQVDLSITLTDTQLEIVDVDESGISSTRLFTCVIENTSFRLYRYDFENEGTNFIAYTCIKIESSLDPDVLQIAMAFLPSVGPGTDDSSQVCLACQLPAQTIALVVQGSKGLPPMPVTLTCHIPHDCPAFGVNAVPCPSPNPIPSDLDIFCDKLLAILDETSSDGAEKVVLRGHRKGKGRKKGGKPKCNKNSGSDEESSEENGKDNCNRMLEEEIRTQCSENAEGETLSVALKQVVNPRRNTLVTRRHLFKKRF